MVTVKVIGWGAALMTVTLFSLVPSLTRLAVRADFNPLQLLAIRLIASMVLLALHLLMTRTPLHLKRRVWPAAVCVGWVNAAAELTMFAALVYVNAALVTMLLAMIPLVVLILLAGRGEPLTHLHLLRLGLGLSSVYVLVGRPEEAHMGMGLLLAGTAVVLFGLQFVLTQWYLADQPAVPVTFYGTLAATGPVVFIYFYLTDPTLPVADVKAWAAVAVLAVGSTYIARLAFLLAVRHLGSGELSLLLPLEMFAGLLWAQALLGEQLAIRHWLGGSLAALSTLVGIYSIRSAALRFWRHLKNF